MPNRTTIASGLAESAKGALERVCSGAGLDQPSRYYSPTFVDHVNDIEFYGLAGAQRSVELYKRTLSDMAIVVHEQIVEGDVVASRFVTTGSCYGRAVRFNGITISRFKDGHIVEDWSVTDTLGMLRQLGLWRALLLAVRSARAMKTSATKQPTTKSGDVGASQNVLT